MGTVSGLARQAIGSPWQDVDRESQGEGRAMSAAQTRYPDHPGHKGGGASLDAALAMKGNAGCLLERTLSCLRDHGPQTAWQVAERLGEHVDNIKPRFSTEQVKAEKQNRQPRCYKHGRAKNPKGNSCTVWAWSNGQSFTPSASRKKRISEMTMDEALKAEALAMKRYGEWQDRAQKRRRAGQDDGECVAAGKRQLAIRNKLMAHMDELREADI